MRHVLIRPRASGSPYRAKYLRPSDFAPPCAQALAPYSGNLPPSQRTANVRCSFKSAGLLPAYRHFCQPNDPTRRGGLVIEACLGKANHRPIDVKYTNCGNLRTFYEPPSLSRIGQRFREEFQIHLASAKFARRPVTPQE